MERMSVKQVAYEPAENNEEYVRADLELKGEQLHKPVNPYTTKESHQVGYVAPTTSENPAFCP
jgi:hypothetical protein